MHGEDCKDVLERDVLGPSSSFQRSRCISSTQQLFDRPTPALVARQSRFECLVARASPAQKRLLGVASCVATELVIHFTAEGSSDQAALFDPLLWLPVLSKLCSVYDYRLFGDAFWIRPLS